MTPLDHDQIHFLRIHQGLVEETRHLFQGALIRVRNARGKTASLAKDAVQALVDKGLMQPSFGGSFHLTEEGKRI